MSRTFDVEWIDDIVVNQFKVLVSKPVLDVAFASGEEVVDDGDLVSLHHQLVNQVRAHKASSTSHLQTPVHYCILPLSLRVVSNEQGVDGQKGLSPSKPRSPENFRYSKTSL